MNLIEPSMPSAISLGLHYIPLVEETKLVEKPKGRKVYGPNTTIEHVRCTYGIKRLTVPLLYSLKLYNRRNFSNFSSILFIENSVNFRQYTCRRTLDEFICFNLVLLYAIAAEHPDYYVEWMVELCE